MERGSRGSSEGCFCGLKASALQMKVYQPTLQAISLNMIKTRILTAVQPQQITTKHWEEWEEAIRLLASVVVLIGKVWHGDAKREDAEAQLLGKWWCGFNGRDPFWFNRQIRKQPHTMVSCLKCVACLPSFILVESRLWKCVRRPRELTSPKAECKRCPSSLLMSFQYKNRQLFSSGCHELPQ